MKVSKSIWDVRFAPRKMALDAACRDALTALDSWITINGSHVELNDRGEVIRGAGGKFNGSRVYDARAKKAAREWQKAHPMMAKPTKLVGEAKTDRHGNPLPQVAIPETLDGAVDYFDKMSKGCYEESQKYRDEAYKNHDAAKDKQADQMYRAGQKYGRLRDEMEEYQNERTGKIGNIGDYMRTMPEEWKTDHADHYVGGLFSYCNEDPTGVGKWAAMNAYTEVEDYLTPARQKYYTDKMSKWKTR